MTSSSLVLSSCRFFIVTTILLSPTAWAANPHPPDAGGAPLAGSSSADAETFADKPYLDPHDLVQAVWLRNPSLVIARESIRAAAADVAQASALDDPSFSYAVAPLSIAHSDMPFGQSARLSQRFPTPGKLDGQRRAAEHRERAARFSETAERRELAYISELLWVEWWEQERALSSNEHHAIFLKKLQASLTAALESGRATLRDPLRIEMELLQLDQERTRLTSAIQIAKARINRMLHRAPDAPLPPPPAELGTFVVHHRRHDGSDAHPLERSSPQLQQMSEELQASVVNEELATLGFWPDFSVETTYSTMFEALPHQWMVGASITLPVQWDAKSARLDAARARIRQTMAREQQLHAKLATEVAEAHVVVDSSTKLMETFESRLLPTARAQVSAAQIAFETGSADLREWVEAENERRSLELARDQAQAASFRASARLRRVVGEFASDERARP